MLTHLNHLKVLFELKLSARCVSATSARYMNSSLKQNAYNQED